jgi:hypothetical protein
MSTSICRRMDPKSDTMTYVYFRNAVCIGGFAKEIRPRPNHVKLPFSENAGGGRVVYAHVHILRAGKMAHAFQVSAND